MSTSRETNTAFNSESSFTLADFTNVLLAINDLANENKHMYFKNYAKQILQFVNLVQRDMTKAKTIEPLILTILKKIEERAILGNKSTDILKKIITDLENGGDRLRILLATAPESYLKALLRQLKNTSAQDTLPVLLRSGGSTAFMVATTDEVQAFLVLEENKRYLLNQINALEAGKLATESEKKNYNKNCLAYVYKCLDQIAILEREIELRYPKIISTYEELFKILEKTHGSDTRNYSLKVNCLMSYSYYCEMYANELVSRENSQRLAANVNQAEQLILQALNALAKIGGYSLNSLHVTARLSYQLAQIKLNQGHQAIAHQALIKSLCCLEDCISLAAANLAKQNQNNNNSVNTPLTLKEIINARTIDLVAVYLSLIKLGLQGGSTIFQTYAFCESACRHANTKYDALSTDIKQLENHSDAMNEVNQFALTDLKANFSALMQLHLQIIFELITLYGQLNQVNEREIPHGFSGQNKLNIIIFIERETAQLEARLNHAIAGNFTDAQEFQKQQDFILSLRLKLLNMKFAHIDGLISSTNTDNSMVLSSLSVATMILSGIKETDFTNSSEVKQRKEELQVRLIQRRTQVHGQLSARSPLQQPRRGNTSQMAPTSPRTTSVRPMTSSDLQTLSFLKPTGPEPDCDLQKQKSCPELESDATPKPSHHKDMK